MQYSNGAGTEQLVYQLLYQDGLQTEYQWGQDFLHPSRLPLGPSQPPIQWVPGHSQGRNSCSWQVREPTCAFKLMFSLLKYYSRQIPYKMIIFLP